MAQKGDKELWYGFKMDAEAGFNFKVIAVLCFN